MEALVAVAYMMGFLILVLTEYALAALGPERTSLDVLRDEALRGARLGGLLSVVGLVVYLVAFRGRLTPDALMAIVLKPLVICTASGAAIGVLEVAAREVGGWRRGRF